MKKTILFFSLCFITLHDCHLFAQNFNYTLSAGSGSYQLLSGATTLASGPTWNTSGYIVPTGFQCNFAGKSFNEVTVAPSGLILFGDDNARAIAAFKGVQPTSGSTLSYKSESGYLKIEYKNVGFGVKSSEDFSFQVWIDAGGKVEFHIGPNNLSALRDSLITPVVGVINPSMDKNSNGYLVEGNPSQPSGTSLTGNELKYLIRIPDENTVYTLTAQ